MREAAVHRGEHLARANFLAAQHNAAQQYVDRVDLARRDQPDDVYPAPAPCAFDRAQQRRAAGIFDDMIGAAPAGNLPHGDVPVGRFHIIDDVIRAERPGARELIIA